MTFIIRPERIEDDYIIEKIISDAFGPGRFAKTAYRLRDNKDHIMDLGFVAQNHLGYVVGTIRYWHFDENKKIILLGPIAIEPDLRNMGLGENLIYTSLDKAKYLGYKKSILIGDPNYYRRFGFNHADAKDIIFPAPIDTNRLVGINL